MQSTPKRTIYLLTHDELTSESYYRRLWMAVKSTPIPRRKWLDELADTFRDFDGVVIHRSGKPFAIPLVDDVFGDDPDLRWLGYYLEATPCGSRPKSRSRKTKRLQLLDLYFRIKHPEIARHFGR